MANWSLLGFGVIAGAALIYSDYAQQSRDADLAFGELGISSYTDTFRTRYDDFLAGQETKAASAKLAERRALGANAYLPEAPEGWTRRRWSEGDNAMISDPKGPPSDIEKEVRSAIQNAGLENVLGPLSTGGDDAKSDANGFVYERDGHMAFVEAELVHPGPQDSMTGMAIVMLEGALSQMEAIEQGYAVVQGVSFTGSLPAFGKKSRKYRMFNGYIGFGEEVRIKIRASKGLPDSALRDLLGRIDYDGMNALLADPLPTIGRDATEVPMEQQVLVASMSHDLRQIAIRERAERTRDAISEMSPGDIALRQLLSDR